MKQKIGLFARFHVHALDVLSVKHNWEIVGAVINGIIKIPLVLVSGILVCIMNLTKSLVHFCIHLATYCKCVSIRVCICVYVYL